MNENEPLVLLHGLGMSARVWAPVRRVLEYPTVAPTLLGHRGGRVPARAPVRVSDVVDDVEARLDDLGVERAHIVGNSLGGWVAIELARRGRARSVCAFSPAGCWTAGTEGQTVGVARIRRLITLTRLGQSLPLMHFAAVRRLALRDVAVRGDRLSASEAREGGRDLLSCTIAEDVLTTPDELQPLDPLPCPITLAWSREDRITPLTSNGAVARSRLPRASWVELPGCGHVPMIDDPERVAATIRHAMRATASRT
ncbi:alpha/beta fold hydrolase [Solirubrobacter soli]|uniref:alpha/beta fold hydrolase n=1 Tax=Solirubrobacter soli TaxID=363832 RepID=UPI00056A4022|nr:alpha/beta fold hydrolase [Solirubrobacter soli]